MKKSPIRKKRPGVRRGPAGIPPCEWRNPKYLRFLKAGHCAICFQGFAVGDGQAHGESIGSWDYTIDPCHGPVNGTGSKGPDAEAIPLCRFHHEIQHHLGWPRFQQKYSFNRAAEAKKWWMAFVNSVA